MLDLCTTGAQITVERIKSFMASGVGVYLWSLVTGMIGILILFLFVSMVLSPSVTLLLLPAIVAFNGAGSGYALTDKYKGDYSHRHFALISQALLLTLFGCVAIVFFCPWEPLFDTGRLLISAAAALIFTFAGNWIAQKSKKLHRSS